MKETGMVRKLDSLGRIVIPKEIRTNLGIDIGDPVEFCVNDRCVIVTKYDATGSVAELVDRLEHEIQMKDYLIPTAQKVALNEKLQELKAIVKEQGVNEDT